MGRKVLLLNASFEVLGTISLERAVRLMLRQLHPVSVEEAVEGKCLRSAGGERLPVPDVVRLKDYVNVRKNIRKSNAKRISVYTNGKFTCAYCGVRVGKINPQLFDDKGRPRKMTMGDLTLDHLIPKSRGGSNGPENLVPACKPCNNRKADRTPREAHMKLLHAPKPVRVGIDRVMMQYLAETHPTWGKYLFSENKGDERYAHTD
jgi:5-methylcytosine-specific restriction endonuclease McrA